MRLTAAGRRLLLLLLTIALGGAWSSPALHAQDAATPAADAVELAGCDPSGSTCEADGISVETVATGVSGEWWWAVFRATLAPGATIEVAGQDLITSFTVSVEAGTVGLTAEVPVICSGECATASGAAAAQGPLLVPAGTELLLAPGDTAVFSEPVGVGHIYRNAGPDAARFVSTVTGPPTPAECYGRCLSPV